MRLTKTVAFAALLLALSGPSLAQQGNQPKPIVKPPSATGGAKVTLPPGVTANIPTLSASEANTAAARKVAAANKWGLSINASNLRPSFWLAAAKPSDPNGASISVVSTVPSNISFTASAGLPHGSVTLKRNPPGGAEYVGLLDVPSSARTWTLVECIVSGADTFHLNIGMAQPAGTGGYTYERKDVPAAGGKLTVLIEPSAAKRAIGLMSYGPATAQWKWGGCEITPIQP